MKNRIFLLILFCLSILFLSDFSFSKDSSAKKSIRKEASLGIGTILDEGQIAGLFSLGIMAMNVFDFELNAGVASVDTIFSGNFSLNLPTHSRVTPYATIGLGMCVHGSLFTNFGGGLKIRLTDKLSLRTEYRYYNVSVIWGGLTYFF